MMDIVKKIDNAVGKLLNGISMTCLVILFVLMVANVFVRFIPVVSLGWYDEIIELLFAWMVFIGSAALQRIKQHFVVDLFLEKLKGKLAGHIVEIFIAVLTFIFYAALFYYGLSLTMRASDTTPILLLPKKLLYLCIPVSGFFMAVYSLSDVMSGLMGAYGLLRPRKYKNWLGLSK